MVTESTVHITWQEPVAPNGMIILYEVNYKRLGDSEVKNVHMRMHAHTLTLRHEHHLHTHLSGLDCSSARRDVSLAGHSVHRFTESSPQLINS